jgi:hypothetical protein
LAACSAAVDDSAPPFPAVLDPPPTRSDTPLDPEQVQRATDDLISARKQLEGEVNVGERDAAPAAKAKAKPSPAAKKKPRKPAPQAAAVNPSAAGVAPAAGSSAKP